MKLIQNRWVHGAKYRIKTPYSFLKGYSEVNNREILTLRNVLAVLGWERTPDQIKTEFGEKLDSVREGFSKLRPHIEDLAIKFNERELSLEEVARILGDRLEKTVSVDDVKHLLLMNSIFAL